MEWIGQVSQVPEESAEGFPAVFDVGFFRADGKTHTGRLRFDSELLEKLYEIGIVLLVEYDKPGIYLISAGFSRYLDRVDVSTGFGIGLIKGYLLILFKQMGAGQARDARSNDGNFHGNAPGNQSVAFSRTQAGTGLRSLTIPRRERKRRR